METQHTKNATLEVDSATIPTSLPKRKIDGLRSLAFVAGLNYVLTTFVVNYMTGRRIVDTSLFISGFISFDFLTLVGWFLVEVSLSFTSLMLITILKIHTWPRIPASIVHYGHLLIPVISTCYICIFWDLALSPRTAGFVEMLVLALKMHSFVHYHRRTPTDKLPSFSDYFMYLLHPTLIYAPSYPRTKRINWGYIVRQSLLCLGAFLVLYVLSTEHIGPTLEASPTANPLQTVASLILPFLAGYILIWFMVFDTILNGFAEISRFAPREFYLDWWNSTTFAEYNRKWNRPVHEWLHRYVYIECQNRYGMSKFTSGMVTFLFSAVAHELFFIVVFKLFRLYFLTLMMLQLPLIIFGEGVKDTLLGNFIFWQGIVLGIPMQVVLYAREAYGGPSMFWTLQVPCFVLVASAATIGGLLMHFAGTKRPSSPKLAPSPPLADPPKTKKTL